MHRVHAHELRTPLASALGHLALLAERDALRLRTLVSDLLHMAHGGDSSPNLQRHEVDLVALVGDSVEAWGPRSTRLG